MIVRLPTAAPSPFAGSRCVLETILRFVDSDDAFTMSHGELEERLVAEGRELIRRLLPPGRPGAAGADEDGLRPARPAGPASQAISQALKLLEPRYPKVAKLLRDAEQDILSFLTFPNEHWRSIRSTNALERVNAEIVRRAKVVAIFPNSASLLRRSTAVLQEQHD